MKIPVRKTPSRPLNSEKLKDVAFSVLDENKAQDIEVITLPEGTALADYMIIASGSSSRQVTALADKLVDALAEKNVKDTRTEGLRNGDWVVVDAHDIIIHIFRPEVRSFYNIEKMWRELPTLSAHSSQLKTH